MKRQRHPHILRLEAAFVDGSDLWMIIPLVKGGSLEGLLQRGHQQVGAPVIPSSLRHSSHVPNWRLQLEHPDFIITICWKGHL